MKIALVSLNQTWENKNKNLELCRKYIQKASSENSDLIHFIVNSAHPPCLDQSYVLIGRISSVMPYHLPFLYPTFARLPANLNPKERNSARLRSFPEVRMAITVYISFFLSCSMSSRASLFP